MLSQNHGSRDIKGKVFFSTAAIAGKNYSKPYLRTLLCVLGGDGTFDIHTE